MIIVEYPWNGKADRICHRSDTGMMLRQNETGALYVKAVDIYPTSHTYTETDIPIPAQPEIQEEPQNE